MAGAGGAPGGAEAGAAVPIESIVAATARTETFPATETLPATENFPAEETLPATETFPAAERRIPYLQSTTVRAA
ncbi:hypothetical protein BU196_04340 [Streptomyces sp. CBMA370]|nr:hypothetical protein [Streptomyces sp. CBMA370]